MSAPVSLLRIAWPSRHCGLSNPHGPHSYKSGGMVWDCPGS